MSHPCLTCGACCAFFRVSFHWSEADPEMGGVVPIELTEPLRALREHGLRVPHDVRVTGFDDIPLAASVSPPLTTVAQDTKQAGQLLVEKLLALVAGETAEGMSIPVKLVLRESSQR